MKTDLKPSAPESTEVPLARFAAYFLWLGTVGFGGPIALAGHMQQDLVDERGWIRKEDYVEGLALAQLAPGPLAAQLAIYLGYIRAGILGATAVGVAFVLPSFVMVLVLSAAYVRFGGLPWMQGMFYGIGAAVIGIITRSAFKLTKLTLGKDKLLWGIFASAGNFNRVDVTGNHLAVSFGRRHKSGCTGFAQANAGSNDRAGVVCRVVGHGRSERHLAADFCVLRQGGNVCVRKWAGGACRFCMAGWCRGITG